MLLVVCDSTPLIYLTKIGRFELLPKLHERLLIPPAVWEEVGVRGAHLPEGRELHSGVTKGWIKVEKPVGLLAISPAEEEDLDPGESEAIQLAIEQRALLAIDETHGRAVAARLGLKITGTVGLLARARREGLIPSLRSDLERLRSTTFRLSESIYLEAIASVGESD